MPILYYEQAVPNLYFVYHTYGIVNEEKMLHQPFLANRLFAEVYVFHRNKLQNTSNIFPVPFLHNNHDKAYFQSRNMQHGISSYHFQNALTPSPILLYYLLPVAKQYPIALFH